MIKWLREDMIGRLNELVIEWMSVLIIEIVKGQWGGAGESEGDLLDMYPKQFFGAPNHVGFFSTNV